MAEIRISGVDEILVRRLEQRAADHGRSVENEAKAILDNALAADHEGDLFLALAELGREVGGVELDLPPRRSPARAADFGT